MPFRRTWQHIWCTYRVNNNTAIIIITVLQATKRNDCRTWVGTNKEAQRRVHSQADKKKTTHVFNEVLGRFNPHPSRTAVFTPANANRSNEGAAQFETLCAVKMCRAVKYQHGEELNFYAAHLNKSCERLLAIHPARNRDHRSGFTGVTGTDLACEKQLFINRAVEKGCIM